MAEQDERVSYEIDGMSTSSDDLASVYLALKRLDALCAREYAEKDGVSDVLAAAAALATKAKTGVNLFLSTVESKEMADYPEKTLPAEMSAVFDAVFDAAFVFGNEKKISVDDLRDRLQKVAVEASKLMPMAARLESELSMKKAKERD